MNYQSDIFNRAAIYDMLFFNVKSVLEYPTLFDLQTSKPEMYDNWLSIISEKYNDSNLPLEKLYKEYAVNYPEYCRIITITYGKVYMNETAGKMDRVLKKITGENETIILETFFDVLNNMNDNITFCSFNGFKDIQNIVKRFIYRRSEVNTIKIIPLSIKKVLSLKPWESGVIDINSVWKFNCYECGVPELSIISSFLGLKKTVQLMSNNDLSKYYWEKIENFPDDTLKNIELQSINETNILIQFINEIRTL